MADLRRSDTGNVVTTLAPIAQGIEHCPPEAGAAVRICVGAHFVTCQASSDFRHLVRTNGHFLERIGTDQSRLVIQDRPDAGVAP